VPKPLTLTIAIPYYKQKKYLKYLLDTISNLNTNSLEVLIVDDASNDNVEEVIDKYQIPNLYLHKLKQNCGISTNANQYVKHAKGKYIMVIPADDNFVPEKITKQIAFLEQNPNIGACFSYCKLIDEKNNFIKLSKNLLANKYQKIFRQKNKSREGWLNHFFYEGNCICGPSGIIRKECFDKIGNFDTRLLSLQDFDLLVRILISGYNIHIIPEELTYYRIHNHNLSKPNKSSYIRSVYENIKILKNYQNLSTKDINKIFPDHKFGKLHNSLIPYYLAQLALKKNDHIRNQYAINTLFDLLNNEKVEKLLITKYNFTPKDFSLLLGKSRILNSFYTNPLFQLKRCLKKI